MGELDIEAIEARAMAANLPPLEVEVDDNRCGIWPVGADRAEDLPIISKYSTLLDIYAAALFAAAPTDIPALVAEVRRLRAENARLTAEPTDVEVGISAMAYSPVRQPNEVRQMRTALQAFLDSRRGAGRD